MSESHRFSHVALTVPSELFEPGPRGELLGFYHDVLGWSEDPRFERAGERILVRAPTNAQYITLRRADSPMVTSGYEHLGVVVDSAPEMHAIHERAARAGKPYPDLDLGPLRELYGGHLLTFRLRFRLPLTLEFQHFAKDDGAAE